MSLVIRRETPEDIGEIHDVTVSAFLEADHSDQTEQFIVQALRKSDALTVSLVAEDAGQIVGHVAISPVVVSDAASHWYGLGPISVIPDKQGKGIGTQLMHEAISALREIGANGCVVLGDPNFYRRFGFESKKELVFPDVPPEYFQSLSFNGVFAQGEVSYHQAFFVTE